MPAKPKVSVIIPTYNRAKFLPTAIKSVLAQTYHNIEIIVIDDGSTDDTQNVLKEFENHIRYLKSDHKGTAHARNVGMKAATGKYIAFLDSDDTYYPYKLQLQVEFIEKHPEVEMLYTEFSGVGEDGYWDEYHLRTYHPNYEMKDWSYDDIFPVKGIHVSSPVDKQIPYYIGDVFEYTIMGTFISTNTMLFPKKILAIVGLQNEAYRFGQDYEFSIRMCRHCKKVAFLDIPTYKLFYHDNQSTRFIAREGSLNQKDILYWITGLELFLNIVLEWGYRDTTYYQRNKNFVDSRLLELYCELGKKWLEYGDAKKAKANFKESQKYGQIAHKYRNYYLLSYSSGILGRSILKLGNKVEKIKWILSKSLNQ